MNDHDDALESRFYRRPEKPVPATVIEMLSRFEFDSTLDYLNKLLEKEPDFEDAWEKKGMVCFLMLKYSDAVQAYDAALKINPANVRAKKGKEEAIYWLKR
ncbi:tetratricopeptide repeat protein [Nitrososphaera viennensis]|uniref:Uncharacterized protein n=2 Tax=Nitrososphaera viennensis TaxID=1034015 RepID=A0A060HFW1_9ARCH|nr:hypothetical protein [Nitrososphaera viennensis]AIC14463.1 hypothetical protein NVIE_002770 [Nitrososphaera viennensis EN76]UVS69443.1 hypothetical protein NWT39_01325 [Nitrososphaera viennensis]